MAYDTVATRYAQALFESAKAQGELETTLEQLALIGGLMREHAGLRRFLLNPDVDPPDKIGVFERALQGSWSALVRAFVSMAVTLGRAEQLPQIAEALQELADADAGRLRVRVRSAHALTEQAVNRLRTCLEGRERKRIELTTETDPTLVGGLQIIIGHRVIDSSLQRQLIELRQRLLAVRVH